MQKKLLFKIWKFPQLSETFIVNQIVIAIKLGYKVKILAGEITDISKNANTKLFEEYNLSEKIIIEDYKIPQQKSSRIFKAAWLVIMNIFLLPHLIKYYKDSAKKGLLPLYEFFFYKAFRNFDTIHIQFGTNKHPVDIMKKSGYLKSQVIVSFHGHDIHFPINGTIENNGYYKRLFKVSNHLICNTQFLKEKLISLGAPPSKIEVIPVAVDTNLFKPNSKSKQSLKIKLVTVGRLDELKGQSFGIDAARSLLQKGYDIEYSLIGTGDYYYKLQKEINNLKLKESIHLLGALSSSEILPILQSSDIFLMTSITNQAGMAESQGLVTAEAQACGLPIVAFDSGGIKYTIQESITGYLCNEKDIVCYTNKIEKLIQNDELRKEMGKSARRFIELEYSEKIVKNKWKIIYS